MYSARITRTHRTAFVLLCDRSGSMAEEVVFRGAAMTKAEAVATIINMFIDELINRSRREEGLRDYFDIAVLEYGGDGVVSLLSGEGGFTTVPELARRPVTIKNYHTERVLPSGNRVSATTAQKCWVEPKACGNTPMGGALEEAAKLLRKWCAMPGNRESFPPAVINITDGEASDADYGELCDSAARIKDLGTEDGGVLLFNIHLASAGDMHAREVRFPCDPAHMPPHKYARLLYDMSSEMPECYDTVLYDGSPGRKPPFRAMSYNCAVDELFRMLTIGSLSVSIMV